MAEQRPGLRPAILRLAQEKACARAVAALQANGVDVLLLKGPSISRWLYRPDEGRLSVDIDLLVSPTDWTTAIAALRGIGFEAPLERAHAAERNPVEMDFVDAHGLNLDLHHRLSGAAAEPPDRCFRVLFENRDEMLVDGVPVSVLAVPARAMHLALHAAANGLRNRKSLEDLRRGLAVLSEAEWEQAARIATAIGAEATVAAGLRCLDEGSRLADRLGLPQPTSVELRMRHDGAPEQAIAFARVAEFPTRRERAAYVYRKLVPTRALLAERYGIDPSSPREVAVGYCRRVTYLVRVGLPGARLWWRTTREVRSASPTDSRTH